MIKVIALDVYGTILASDDYDNVYPFRKGLESFFKKCNDEKVILVTSSDSDLINLKIDLKESNIDLNQFNDFYELKQIPKDYNWIIKDYGISSKELLVIGDSYKDIEGAKESGASYYKVPEYKVGFNDFDFREIKF